MKLQGKCAIVTGGASGIGAAIAERLGSDGASVLIADKNYVGAQATADRLVGLGYTVRAAEADVASSASASATISQCVKEFGGLNVLVNNAGIVHRDDTDAESTPEHVWDLTLSINLKSVFLWSKFAIPAIEQSGGGSIINIASVVALLGSFPSQIAYTASKGGMIALSRELAVVLARRKIRVNAICPGLTATAIADQVVKDDSGYQLRRLHIPMGRMAKPEEIASTASFLASDDSSYITGQQFSVDGGMTAAYLTPPDQV